MMALTAFLLTFTAQGQTMRSLWIAMPDSLFPYLDRNAMFLQSSLFSTTYEMAIIPQQLAILPVSLFSGSPRHSRRSFS